VSVDFDPVAVRPRRRIDPLVFVVAAVVIALGAAVLKPWDFGVSPEPSVRPAAAVVPSTSPTASLVPAATSPRESAARAEPPTWADFASVIESHDGWGVQTVARRQIPPWSLDRPTYLEDWTPTTLAVDGTENALVEPADGPVVLLGLTVPAGVVPQAIRIWRIHLGDRLEWMDLTEIGGAGSGRTYLFLRPGTVDAPYLAWAAGRYRIDVLVGERLMRIGVAVPDRRGEVPTPETWSAEADGIVPASLSDPPALFAGMFAYVDGRATPLPAAAHPLLGEREAWVDLATSGGAGIVGSAYLPRASALGIMLPPGATVEVVTMHRLAPDTRFEEPPALRGTSDRRGHSPFVIFEAPDGGVWAPGIYAISMTWTYRDSIHHDAWHVELRPGRG
jgi:hypothetical protein